METEDLILNFIGIDLISNIAMGIGRSLEALVAKTIAVKDSAAAMWASVGLKAIGAGVALLAVDAVLVAIAAHSIGAAVRFQSDMVMIVTHAQLASGQLKQLSSDLLAMAPQVGFGPDALAQAFYHVQSVVATTMPQLDNLSAKEEILRQSAELAAIGHADLTDTVNTLLGVMVNYQGTNLSAANAAAQLNAIIGTGNLTMQTFADSMANGLMPVAAQQGVSFASLGAALGTLTDEHYSAARASTYLRSAIIQMTQPTGPAAKALEAIGLAGADVAKQQGYFSEVLQKAGVSQTEVANALHKSGSLSDVLSNVLMPALKKAGLSSQDSASLIEKAFGGIRSGAGILGLTNNLVGLKDKEDAINKSTKDWTATWDFYRKNDPQFIINQLGAGLQSLEVILGGVLIPVMSMLVGIITPIVAKLAAWIDKHQELARNIMIGVMAGLAIVGVILIIMGIVTVVAAVIAAFTSGWFLLAAALVVAGAIALGFGGKIGPLTPMLTAIGNAASHVAKGFQEAIGVWNRTHNATFALESVLMGLGLSMDKAYGFAHGLSSALSILWSILQKVWHAIQDQVSGVAAYLQKDAAMQNALHDLRDAWNQLQPALQAIGVALAIVGAVIAVLLGGVFQGLMTAFQFILPGAIMIFSGAIEVVSGVIMLFVDFITGHWDKMGMDIVHITDGMWNIVKGLVYGVLGGIIGFIVGFIAGVIGAFRNLSNALVGHSIIPDMINSIVNYFRNLPGQVLGILEGMIGSVSSAASRIGSAIFRGITGALAGLGGAIKGLIEGAIPGGMGGPLGDVARGLGLASGGLVTKPTLALVGEAGPELVIPLRDLKGGPAAAAFVPQMSGGGSGQNPEAAKLRAALTAIANALQKASKSDDSQQTVGILKRIADDICAIRNDSGSVGASFAVSRLGS